MGRKRLYFSEEHGAGAAVANGAEDRHFVGALARGLEVLACFRKGETMLGNQEIASRCKLPKSTVSRLTYTLTKLGYLHYIESVAKYRLGTAVLALGTTMLARLDVRNFAKPLMEELAATTRASVALGTRDRLSMVYVECVRGPSAISLNIDVGSRISISTSAMGRAFLAASTEEERAPIYEEMRALDSVKWPRTREMIAKSLADHQTLGCTRSFGEWHESVNAIAVGFRPGGGLPPMVINCSGPSMVTGPDFLMDEARPRLIAVCRRLEGSMGTLAPQYCNFSKLAPDPLQQTVRPMVAET
jgi:DNA-binding IclR family transcriptional regulator